MSGEISVAAIRGEIEALAAKRHGVAVAEPRVIGVLARPEPSLAQEFTHTVAGRRTQVRVVPCVSALAARQALIERDPESWLVLVTDRNEADLGAGVLAHLIGNRLRLVDPWVGVRGLFGAAGVDRSLTHLAQSRAVAEGMLALADAGAPPWPAAPVGLLTLEHLAGSVAHRQLGFAAAPTDGVAVLAWAARPDAVSAVCVLRRRGGDALTDAILDWLAGRTGSAAPVVAPHLREARPQALLPLGIACQTLRAARTHDAQAAAAWQRFTVAAPSSLARPGAADALAMLATTVVGDLLDSRTDWRLALPLLEEADRLLGEAGAGQWAAQSPLLPSGLSARFGAVATALRDQTDPESAFASLDQHALVQLAPPERLPSAYQPTHAALRLWRWLDRPDTPQGTFATRTRGQVAEDAWVDSALHDAAGGVAEAELGAAIAGVVALARERRTQHDVGYADALSRSARAGDGADGPLLGDGDPVLPLERVLQTLVAPLAKECPALLLVLDGMTARVAAELIEDLQQTGRGWVEARWPGYQARAAAAAVLPTLTEHSRTSLLCGRIVSGNQQTERDQHPKLMASLGAGPTRIFHKKDLDTVPDGHRLSNDVHAALTDASVRLVTCVLNTIDDALDRSDPGGTEWRLDTVKHLAALLELAAQVGRPVVLASDHGHVLERRRGTAQLPAGSAATSARSRTADVAPGPGEVLVEGPRVAGSRAVLAVDGDLRYTGLKAGYHGGASPAEVAVPVVLLWPGPVPAETGYAEAPSQRPSWWDTPSPASSTTSAADPAANDPAPEAGPTLFGPDDEPPSGPGAAVIGSPTWQQQRLAFRRTVLDEQRCVRLLDQLAAAAGTRLPRATVARLLDLPEARVAGAIAHLQNLLNVDGYPVVREDSGMLVLDVALLREQFGVRS
ncbi:BREX-2 system phosphatase PglZ [Naumannella sp. ID2617S]|nr:BREX-2 system phosphatase PglZ [Naumannella sp. ID2617S]